MKKEKEKNFRMVQSFTAHKHMEKELKKGNVHGMCWLKKIKLNGRQVGKKRGKKNMEPED